MAELATQKTTRDRLIEAAGELFAEKGFKETTVRDIIERAGANLAAVNYHFGDKERLYEEVILHILNGIKEEFPVDKGIDESLSAEDRLHVFVSNMLYRFIDPQRPAWQSILFARERMNPRPIILTVIHEEISKVLVLLYSIVQELLGADAGADEMELCILSVMGQLMFQAHIRSSHAPPMFKKDNLTTDEIKGLIRHITDFSLAGIERVRQTREESAGKQR